MTRRVMIVAMLMVGFLALWSPVQAVAATTSDGIGMSREDWEAEHGEGDVGESIVSYEDDRYYVGFLNGVVSFIETGWEDSDGVKFSLAVDEVRDLLPADAELVESSNFLATPAGPIGIVVLRYESDELSDLIGLNAADQEATSISVLLQLTGERLQSEPLIARASIVVGFES